MKFITLVNVRMIFVCSVGLSMKLHFLQYLNINRNSNFMGSQVMKKTTLVRQMSRLMGKPTICIGENKDADQLRGNREADQRLCFRYSVQFLFYLNPNFHASSSFLCLYKPICVVPVRKPHCWFSHEAAQMLA